MKSHDTSAVNGDDGQIMEKPRKSPRQRSVPHYIYVIAAKYVVKIGFSYDPKKRLYGIQTGFPYRLFISSTHQVPASRARKIEALIHERLNYCHRHGEWFAICPRDADAAVAAVVREVYFWGFKGTPASRAGTSASLAA